MRRKDCNDNCPPQISIFKKSKSNRGAESLNVNIKTFGCQMNVRDSEVIVGLLMKNGYHLTSERSEADIIIYNTCSVRQHAEDKVWSEIGRNCKRRTKDEGRKTIIGLVGCMAKVHKEKAFERATDIDFVVGPQDIDKIPTIIKKFRSQKPGAKSQNLLEYKIWETEGDGRPEEIYHAGFYEDKTHAYVVISQGCSNFCSYCVVPYVRGDLKNRNYKDILREIEEAVDKGITRVTLLGQNVNAYISGCKSQVSNSESEINFIDLLEMVNKIKGLEEFSFITSHPKDTTVELFKAMRDLDRLKRYLHLPVQSGSDKILELMNRRYTRKFYLDLADGYHKIVKDGVLTTDIIVGFPTESEDDFQETFSLMKEIEFEKSYIFKYSPRPYTSASQLNDDVSQEIKKKRHQFLLDFQRKISLKKCPKNI